MPKAERYESPSHERLQQLKVRVRPEIYAAYAQATAVAGESKQDPIEKFCEQYARERGIKIRAPRPSGGDNSLS
jgi:hypothetical protein